MEFLAGRGDASGQGLRGRLAAKERATLIAAAVGDPGLLGFSLNTLSLLAITLVTGILVDDAIVEIENIVRHGRKGKAPFQAAIDASDQIGFVVVAISATIIAVFVPVGFMGSVVGQYFREFGLTVAIAVSFRFSSPA